MFLNSYRDAVAIVIAGLVLVAVAGALVYAHVYLPERARWAPFNRRRDYLGVDLTDIDAASHRAAYVVREVFEHTPDPISFRVAVSCDVHQVLAVTVIFEGPVARISNRRWREVMATRVQKFLAALLGGEWTTHWQVSDTAVADEVQFTRVQEAVRVEPVAPVADGADAPPAVRTGDTGTVSSRASVDLEQMHADAARARWARVAYAPTSDERRQANEACACHVDVLLELLERNGADGNRPSTHRTVLASEPFGVTLCEQTLHAQAHVTDLSRAANAPAGQAVPAPTTRG